MPSWLRYAELVDSAFREDTGLIESALFALCAVERYGNDEQLCWRVESELGDGGCKHGTQPDGDRVHPVVLERVDGGTHASVIGTE
jgi:hypothetical protein